MAAVRSENLKTPVRVRAMDCLPKTSANHAMVLLCAAINSRIILRAIFGVERYQNQLLGLSLGQVMRDFVFLLGLLRKNAGFFSYC